MRHNCLASRHHLREYWIVLLVEYDYIGGKVLTNVENHVRLFVSRGIDLHCCACVCVVTHPELRL
jgi:hypothetical protein